MFLTYNYNDSIKSVNDHYLGLPVSWRMCSVKLVKEGTLSNRHQSLYALFMADMICGICLGALYG